MTEAKLAAKLAKVAERLQADAPNLERPGADLIAWYLSPDRHPAGRWSIPPHVLPVLEAHMTAWTGRDRVFVGRDGRPMRGDAVRQAFNRARLKAGMPGFRFHDLRHTGQTTALNFQDFCN